MTTSVIARIGVDLRELEVVMSVRPRPAQRPAESQHSAVPRNYPRLVTREQAEHALAQLKNNVQIGVEGVDDCVLGLLEQCTPEMVRELIRAWKQCGMGLPTYSKCAALLEVLTPHAAKTKETARG